MTVQELIDELKKFDPNKPVGVFVPYGYPAVGGKFVALHPDEHEDGRVYLVSNRRR